MALGRVSWLQMIAVMVFLVTLDILHGQEEECPCTWKEENREWDCRNDDIRKIPTQCWPLQPNVERIIFECWIPGTIANDSFIHPNLLNLQHLELESAEFVPYEAVNHLVNLTYLSLFRCHNEEMPDISNLEKLQELNVAENRLTTVPSLVHLTHLRKVNVAINSVKNLPDLFLPATAGNLEAVLYINKFHEINASSIIHVTDGSVLTLDQLTAIWATEEERDIMLEKQIESNIDLISIIKIIEDPTDP